MILPEHGTLGKSVQVLDRGVYPTRHKCLQEHRWSDNGGLRQWPTVDMLQHAAYAFTSSGADGSRMYFKATFPTAVNFYYAAQPKPR